MAVGHPGHHQQPEDGQHQEGHDAETGSEARPRLLGDAGQGLAHEGRLRAGPLDGAGDREGHQHGRHEDAGRRRGREPREGAVVLLVVVVLHVEARQPQDGHQRVEGRREEVEPSVQDAMVLEEHLGQQPRGDAEGDGVGEAVQLRTQVAEGPRHAGHASVEGVQQERTKDEPAGRLEVPGEERGVGRREGVDPLGDGEQPQEGVPEGEQVRQGLGATHGGPPGCAAGAAANLDRGWYPRAGAPSPDRRFLGALGGASSGIGENLRNPRARVEPRPGTALASPAP